MRKTANAMDPPMIPPIWPPVRPPDEVGVPVDPDGACVVVCESFTVHEK